MKKDYYTAKKSVSLQTKLAGLPGGANRCHTSDAAPVQPFMKDIHKYCLIYKYIIMQHNYETPEVRLVLAKWRMATC